MHIASESNFHGLWGSSGLQMISEVKVDLRIELSDLNYPGIHVYIASWGHFGGLWGPGGPQVTSEVKADLKIELGDLNYLCSHASLTCKGFLEMIPTTNGRPIMIHRVA